MHPIVEKLLDTAANGQGKDFDYATEMLMEFMYINLGDMDMDQREARFMIPPPDGLPQIVLTEKEKKYIIDRVNQLIVPRNLERNSRLLWILTESPGELTIAPMLEIIEKLKIYQKDFFDGEFHQVAVAIDNFLFRFNYENDINNSEYVEFLTSPAIYAVVDAMMKADHRIPGYSQERAIQIQRCLRILERLERGEDLNKVCNEEWAKAQKYKEQLEYNPSILERLKQGESLDDIFPDEEE